MRVGRPPLSLGQHGTIAMERRGDSARRRGFARGMTRCIGWLRRGIPPPTPEPG